MCSNPSRFSFTAYAQRRTVNTVSYTHLDQLEEKGLISRQTCASDRRAKRIKLTEKAEPLISEMEAVINKTRAEILYGISAEELEQLIKLIAKLEHNIIELQAKG